MTEPPIRPQSWNPTPSAALVPDPGWSSRHLVLGGLAGVASAGTPVALVIVYLAAFTVSGTPESGFNVFVLGVLAGTLIVLGLCVGAVVLALSPPTRSIGIGYLSGVGAVAVLAGVGAVLMYIWAAGTVELG